MRPTPERSGDPVGTAASGASNRTMPRLVLTSVTRRVALIADSTVSPTGRPAARSISGAMAAALRRKSRAVISAKSAPRWTLPGLRAITSRTQANWAHSPIDNSATARPRGEEGDGFAGHVHTTHRGQGAPTGDGVHLDDEALAIRSRQQVHSGDRRADGVRRPQRQLFVRGRQAR